MTYANRDKLIQEGISFACGDGMEYIRRHALKAAEQFKKDANENLRRGSIDGHEYNSDAANFFAELAKVVDRCDKQRSGACRVTLVYKYDSKHVAHFESEHAKKTRARAAIQNI